MIYVGDALFPGGNDYPVVRTGIATIAVTGPPQTRCVIQTIIAMLSD